MTFSTYLNCYVVYNYMNALGNTNQSDKDNKILCHTRNYVQGDKLKMIEM